MLTYTMPFWLLLLAWVFLGERLRGLQWPALPLALAGFIVLLAPWSLRGVRSTVLAIAAGLTWAASAVLVKAMQRRHHVDLLSFTAWQMLFGSALLAVIAALTWTKGPIWSPQLLWALGYAVLLGNAIGWLLWVFVLRGLGAGEAGIGTLAIPVVGLIAAGIQLGERPSLVDAAGMTAIIIALAMITVSDALRGRRGMQGLPVYSSPKSRSSRIP